MSSIPFSLISLFTVVTSLQFGFANGNNVDANVAVTLNIQYTDTYPADIPPTRTLFDGIVTSTYKVCLTMENRINSLTESGRQL